MRAMLDLSSSPFMVFMLSYVVMGVAGIVMVFLLRLWNRGWVWVSIQTLRVFRRTGHKRVLGMPKIMVFKGVFINP